jgi:hypothetical protein
MQSSLGAAAFWATNWHNEQTANRFPGFFK